MNALYEKFQRLKVDTAYIGLAHEENTPYFCTPIGATIIGWDNGIHYIFIKGFGEMVFAVNPDTCCDHYVYPLAKSFLDFLSLILAVKNTNTLQQIIQWDRQQYLDFINSPGERAYASRQEVTEVLEAIRSLGILPINNPFTYIKEVQKNFPYAKIPFRDEFYDVTGKERVK